MREKKHPRQKEWERLQQREALLLRRRRKEDGSFLEELLSDKVPQGLEQTLNKAFAKAFGLVFSKGAIVIERTYSKERRRAEFRARAETLSEDESKQSLRSFSQSAGLSSNAHVVFAGVEGVGLGLLGIGLPDIPLFSAVLLRSVYEIAMRFGYSYEDEQERDFILCLIAASLRRGAAFEAADRALNHWIDWGKRPEAPREALMEDAARALSDYLLYAKFVQGIPLVGALGGVSDSFCLNRVTRYARLKYHRRFLRQGGPAIPG